MRIGRGRKRAPVQVTERWRQVFRAGEAELHGFTAAQLAAVSLREDALPPEPGPVLHAAAAADPAAPGNVSSGNLSPEDEAADDAVAALEQGGFILPWPPAAPQSPIAEELPGWARTRDGRTQVALAGDLAVIASTRSRPAWIAEVSTSTDPAWPEPDDTEWSLTARIYARYRPPAGLLEFPAGPDGTSAPHVLLRDDRVLATLVAWCGGEEAAAPREPGQESDTSQIADRFARVTRVSVALPDGDEVRIRSLIAASGDGGLWLLEGRYWERALSVTADDLGARLSAIVKSAAS